MKTEITKKQTLNTVEAQQYQKTQEVLVFLVTVFIKIRRAMATIICTIMILILYLQMHDLLNPNCTLLLIPWKRSMVT